MSAPIATLSERRAGVPHTSMILRMLMRAAVLRRGRAVSALLAMVVAAAVATAMMNLYVDVQAKLRKEFRSYGANIVVVGKDGASLPADALQKVETALGSRDVAVPLAYVVARTSTGQSVVVVGTNFDRVQRLNRWWSVSTWPSDKGEALIGMRAMPVVSPDGKPFELTFQGHTIHLNAAGTLQTGAAEDSRVYLPMTEFLAWSGVQPTTIEVAANGSTEEVNGTMRSRSRKFGRSDRSWKARLVCSVKRAPPFTPLLS
jgi:putative ABC transport system permease protein